MSNPRPRDASHAAMFIRMLMFELRYYARRPSTWIFIVVFAAMGFMMINAAGGAFRMLQATVPGRELVNSPSALVQWLAGMGVISLIATGAIMGGAATRDFEIGIDSLFFTTPVPPRVYLSARFIGAFVAAFLVQLAIPVGIMLGSAMPYLLRQTIGPFWLEAYAMPFTTVVIPNLLFASIMFFTIGMLGRRPVVNNIGGIVVMTIYFIANANAGNLEHRPLGAIIDPFGQIAADQITQYWTPEEKNARLVPFAGVFLMNRLLWLTVSLVTIAVLFRRFRFAHYPPISARLRLQHPRRDASEVIRPTGVETLPAVRTFDGWGARVLQFRRMVKRDLGVIFKSRSIYVIGILGLITLIIIGGQAARIYGTPTYPVTATVLATLGPVWASFLGIVVGLYAGELTWVEREVGASSITDTLPTPTWLSYVSKLAALVCIAGIMFVVAMISGMIIQVAGGYYRFELGLYVKDLFGIQLVDVVLFAVLALAVQAVVNQKYLGYLVLLAVSAAIDFMPLVGLEHPLFRYSSDSGVWYSDMTGYGSTLGPWVWWKVYWGAFAVLLAILSVLVWVRGYESRWPTRAALMRSKLRSEWRTPVLLAVGLWAMVAAWIFYNTNVLNTHRGSTAQVRYSAGYEKKFGKFREMTQPRVVGVSLNVDLTPEREAARFSGRYWLKNKTAIRIDSIHILGSTSESSRIEKLEFDRDARLVLNENDYRYRIYALGSPLLPGDSVALDFRVRYEPKGFAKSAVVPRGTFLDNSEILHIGYDPGRELRENSERRRHGLQTRPPMAPPTDSIQRLRNYVSAEGDWIRFDATISTAPDEIAVAPGKLQREWSENGRRYFHYAMNAPMLDFFTIVSGKYAVRKANANGVEVSVLYHPTHTFDIDRIVDGAIKSLDFYGEAFGAYPWTDLRIVEFPRFRGTFAQSFATTIPFSEAIGFLARVDREKNIDYPLYVTAHEVAHQWWANRVVGANVQGATLLSEALAQYGALMVMEREVTPSGMRRFLKYELDAYLRGRGSERGDEEPLTLVEPDQQYIHYSKGSVAMYALRDFFGAPLMNSVLRRFVDQWGFKEPPYPTSLDLVQALNAAAPDSLRSVIRDQLETVTLYDNQIMSATARSVGSDTYEVDLVVKTAKSRVDAMNRQVATEMSDLVDVGVFEAGGNSEKEGKPLYLAKHRLRGRTDTIRVKVSGKPARAGVDPMNKLVDRNSGDNVIDVVTRR
jgi:ABC-2 type transport system permease protein